MKRLEGKTALVTGSGRNIGRAIILKLAEEGANVVVNARSNKEEVESVADEAGALGVEALPFLADVSDHQQVTNMFAAAAEQFGGMGILVSNAAIRPRKPFTELTLEDWEGCGEWCWTEHFIAPTRPCLPWKKMNMAGWCSSPGTVPSPGQPRVPTCRRPRWE